MKVNVLFFLAAGLLLAADAPKDDASKKDMDQLQGSWRLISRERDGKADAADAVKDIIMINKGDRFTFKGAASGAGATEGTFTVDATKKPKAMDRTPADGPRKGKLVPSIYALDGDTLKICAALGGGERPKEFTSKAGSGHVLSVFKREKP